MYLIFDTETTGLPKNFNAPLTDSNNWPRMVQIAWQLHDDDGTLLENEDYIIQPDGYDIPFNAYKIHGISTKKAQSEGRNLVDVLIEFADVLARTKVGVGHNIEFDYNIVGAEFLRSGLENPLQNVPNADTMHLGTNYCELPGGRYGKFKSPKLTELYEKLFSTKFDEAHNAAADVNATAQIFFELMRLNLIPTENLKITEEKLQLYITSHPQITKAFDIKIRAQVGNSKGKKTVKSSGNTDDLDIGKYFNFHNHSIFSSLQSTSSIAQLIKKAEDNNFPAVGLVDMGNLMGAFKFITEVEKYNKNLETANATITNENEIKKPLIPILGCEFYVSDRPEQKQFTKDDRDRRTNMVLLAKNFEGYKNLAKLSSVGFVDGFYFGVPRISKKQIEQYKENLIAVSSGITGDIPSTILEFGEQKGEEVFLWWKKTFGEDFYVQIQNHNVEEEVYINEVLTGLAEQHEVKILAQNETYYSEKEDAPIQDILVCIKEGEKLSTPIGRGFNKRSGLTTSEYYIKDTENLKKTFQNFPNAFEAYAEFLEKFKPYSLKHDVLLPKFNIPEEFLNVEDETDGGKRGENAYLRFLTYEGAKKRYGEISPELIERLDFELEVIGNTGYPGYFLIVQDFCNEARKMGVWVGPGRGSAAGSVVAYCTGITNIDPIKYDLLFERFLNPERVSMPDIDIDFDDEGRERIIKWVIEKYGKENVAQIITYSVLGGKSAIKDAGRVLDLSIADTNAISKLIPSVPGMNIKKALAKIDKLRPEDQILAKEMQAILNNPSDERFAVLNSAYKLEGCIRNTGIHACAVIITPEDISNLIPITIANKDANIIVSQFDNSVAENAGLLKMDFLGLRTLTIIKDAIKIIKEKHGIDIDPDAIPLDDEKTYQLFQEGKTVGIFQYESPGMQKYMRELKPTVFEDLIAMNALYRPGPIKYIPNFINRKNGSEEMQYDLPECEEFLSETYGITVYQEQVMLLSQKLANFTKGEADTLRKAMGKKDRPTLDKMYPKFLEGGQANNLNEEKLNKIWKDWEAFAEYAFNKSHSTCYAFIAYQTAYLKANYPAEYMSSVLTHNLNNTKQITLFMEDCKNVGIDVLGPDINESAYKFTVNDKHQIRFGLGAIKGIGEGPSEAIVEARKGQRFNTIYEFFERIPANQMNKRVAESLVYAGAFDEVEEYNRAQYFENDLSGRNTLEKLMKYGQSFQESKNQIENSLFADFAEELSIKTPEIPDGPEWQNMHKLNKEREVIGFYLSAHPLDEFNFQYDFIKGTYSKKVVLDDNTDKETEFKEIILVEEIDEESTETEIVDEVVDLDGAEADEILEQEIKNVEPRGQFGFLQLDELDAFRDATYNPEQLRLFEEKDYKAKRAHNDGSKEYMVAGLITEFTVRDGNNSGEKVAFMTLEDYSGSYSFRLGDRDYMRLKDQLDVQRFVILKVKFSISKDHRIYLNVTDVIELKEALEKFAKSISVVLDVQHFHTDDALFLKKNLMGKNGEGKLKFYMKNEDNNSFMDLETSTKTLSIDQNLLQILNNQQNFKFFLN
ncbi:DNA polymerase III subunit alpha [Frigoriflavimonas asaccharolytica]|uniref:DNA polymerase III subunit alpha n=1 Tax=Frigoriflavimonas asaccharolytica TaxID=2735899 RepID=A0A8J8G8Q8_9FLAO|nr:DNA polymerase III subunit alpha [Frigoriflavimonas asaccharolytica]NRS93006.1 DNA polymerase-3 subunit alpha [Frigoriflavimonas asaccharolytica]